LLNIKRFYFTKIYESNYLSYRFVLVTIILFHSLSSVRTVPAQVPVVNTGHILSAYKDDSQSKDQQVTLHKYVDQGNGMSVDEAVKYALAHHGELLALRSEIEAARSKFKQAGLKPNPMVEVRRGEQIRGTDSSLMASVMLPLELGGRRSARIEVAQRELVMKELMISDRERIVAYEVREKFGRTLAEIRKFEVVEELLSINRRDYSLIDARVTEGRTAPLERNMLLVEVNRARSMREGQEANVEVAIFELKNLLGMKPEESLSLRGDLKEPSTLPTLAEATERALKDRPDLRTVRAAEAVAEAMIEQARAEGRIDASLMAGYQRMKSGFPLSGIDDRGGLSPIDMTSHSVVAGVTLTLPVRNKNQGSVAAAVAELEAARRRREFAELTIRREVAASYAQYERTMRALGIFRTGVLEGAKQNLKVIYQTYELGSKNLSDYIGEQRRFIDIENEYVDSLLDTYLARLEVERAIASPELVTK
jgi:outer membrane protein, heavy metal efflux system